jgi:hypothetical protein
MSFSYEDEILRIFMVTADPAGTVMATREPSLFSRVLQTLLQIEHIEMFENKRHDILFGEDKEG